MKFFIDTADVEEIKQAHRRGWVDGVTTNPTLIAKSGRKFHDVIKEISRRNGHRGPRACGACEQCRG
jgi:transaldolase